MVSKPGFGQLNSVEHSQEPEVLEPENLNGLDLIVKNNQDATNPNVLKKLVGPFKGTVFKGVGDQIVVKKDTEQKSWLSFLGVGAADLKKYRIRIPEIHSHLPDLGDDLANVPATIAATYPEFIAASSDLPEVAPNTLVWCNYLDRANFKDPVYLGPVDSKKADNSGGNAATSQPAGLLGIANGGDTIGGGSMNNTGQVSYAMITGSSNVAQPVNGFTTTTATVEDLLNLARQQIGKIENPPRSNGGQLIDPFNGSRREAWCAAGIAWCFRQIGAPLPGDRIPSPGPNGWNNAHGVTWHQNWSQQLGTWTQIPQPGDMVIYSTESDPTLAAMANSSRHIGLVEKVEGDIIYTIEFNWGDKVQTKIQNYKTMKSGTKGTGKPGPTVLGFARRPLPFGNNK